MTAAQDMHDIVDLMYVLYVHSRVMGGGGGLQSIVGGRYMYVYVVT